MEQTQPSAAANSIPEDEHWWFATRTWAIEKFLGALPRSGGLDILDIGCGAGNMIHHLSRYGRVKGIEVDARPVRMAQQRGYDVRQADATQRIPFADGSFDLVTALDVIEHVDQDHRILEEAYRVLRPGGCVLVTTPAFQWLWSDNDELNAHKRRYTAGQLAGGMQAAGLQVKRISYNFFLVFPISAPLIVWRNRTHKKLNLDSHHVNEEAYQVEMEPVSPLLNAVLRGTGRIEAALIGAVNLPLGTSLICIAQK
ncbi:MAG: class I SAM-dependent methyltransferase [Rudaea sp.]